MRTRADYDARVQGGDKAPVCRYCFEEEIPDKRGGRFVSPCKCSGSQKYVHLKCLRKWQKMHENDARAVRCGVCNAIFTIKPPRPSLMSAICMIFESFTMWALQFILVVSISQILVAQVALLLWAVLYSNACGLFAVPMALGLAFLLVPRLCGFRITMQVLEDGQTRLAIVRHGSKVVGLGEGCLLVASPNLEGSLFEKAVIFVYEHSDRYGASGLILNSPVDASDVTRVASPIVSDWIGGPVGLRLEDGSSEIFSMHKCEYRATINAKAGSFLMLTHPIPADPMIGSTEVRLEDPGQPHVPNVNVTSGYAVQQLLEYARRRYPFTASTLRESDRLRIYHGRSCWSSGQLEGEVRSAIWGFCKASMADIFDTPQAVLWDKLMESDRLQWLNPHATS